MVALSDVADLPRRVGNDVNAADMTHAVLDDPVAGPPAAAGEDRARWASRPAALDQRIAEQAQLPTEPSGSAAAVRAMRNRGRGLYAGRMRRLRES